MISSVLTEFGFRENDYHFSPYGNGLINSTWLIERNENDEKFVLQKINHTVFRSPGDIAFNISLIADHLKQHHPEYLFIAPLKTTGGEELLNFNGEYFRLFPFVPGSYTIDTVQQPAQAYEAASQFGKFTKLLSGLEINRLKISLPDFHNLSLRYLQFENVLITGDKLRLKQSRDMISFIQQHRNIAGELEYYKPEFITRCTHHDTKISNVLFDVNDKGICVIDLDTVMPGYFISDVGDMMRTYLSPVNEEEKDFSAIGIRPAFYKAIVDGYMAEMGEEWTSHNSKIKDSHEIWFAVMGPGILAKGEIKKPIQFYQKQFAQTMASLLGLHFTCEHEVAEKIDLNRD